jgi:hypothetical protein
LTSYLPLDETQNPALARLDRAIEEAEDRRRFPGGHAGHAEDWGQWWQAVAAEPALADAAAERERGTVHHHGPEGALLAVHTAALAAAGFAETGTLWQRGSNRLLVAIR